MESVFFDNGVLRLLWAFLLPRFDFLRCDPLEAGVGPPEPVSDAGDTSSTGASALELPCDAAELSRELLCEAELSPTAAALDVDIRRSIVTANFSSGSLVCAKLPLARVPLALQSAGGARRTSVGLTSNQPV
jgi:hypothetical protein